MTALVALDETVLACADQVGPNSPILVAASGGGDSMALVAALVARYGPGRLRALIVDHALRPEAAAEANSAAHAIQKLGVATEISRLSWPDNGVRPGHAKARKARMAVLSTAARAHGARCVAFGHTADDQAETILMRAAHASDWPGLAGIRPFASMPIWPQGAGLWAMRPLLKARRSDLRAWLRACGISWLEDTSNTDSAFERVRTRTVLQVAPEHISRRLANLADRIAARAIELDGHAARAIAAHAAFESGEIRCPPQLFNGAVGARALAVLVASVGGAEAAPSLREAAALRSRVQSANAGTLAGAMIRVSQQRGWRFMRDSGGVHGRADGATALPPLPLAEGIETVWDNRLALITTEQGWVAEPGPDGGPVLTKRGSPLRDRDGADPEVSRRWLLKLRAAHLLGLSTL